MTRDMHTVEFASYYAQFADWTPDREEERIARIVEESREVEMESDGPSGA